MTDSEAEPSPSGTVAPARFASIGVDDTFPSGNDVYEDLMKRYGITGVSLAERARKMLSIAGG